MSYKKYPYIINVLIGIDQLLNAICDRNPDETISSYLGREARRYGGTIPWRKPLNAIIYRALEHIDPGHCERSIEVVDD